MTSAATQRLLKLLLLSSLILLYMSTLHLGYIQSDGVIISIAKNIRDGTYPQVMTGFLHSSFFARIVSFILPFFHDPLWLPRAVTKTCGILCIVFTYFLARKIYNEKIALASSLLFATSVWHYRITHTGQELFTPLFSVMSLYSAVHYSHSGKPRFLALSGIFIAFAMLSQPVTCSFLIVFFLSSWFRGKFKQAIRDGVILLAACAITLSPVLYFLKANYAAIQKEVHYYVFLGKPAREVTTFFNQGFIAGSKENFLEFVRGALFCLMPQGTAHSIFYSLPSFLFLISAAYFIAILIRRKARTDDLLLLLWLFVCAFTLTFFAPWTSRIRFPESNASMRPPWYYSIFFPLPYIMISKMLYDGFVFFTGRMRQMFLLPFVILFVQQLFAVYTLFHPAETLEGAAYAHVFKYAKPGTLLMSNIPPGDYRNIKSFSYFLKPSANFIAQNRKDLQALYSINAVYSAFLYQSQASKTLLLTHPLQNSSGSFVNFLSFENLPVVSLSMLKHFESVPETKLEDIYYLLYQGNCSGALFCAFDFLPASQYADTLIFHMMNPELSPVKTFTSASSPRNKIELYHFKINRRSYTKIRFTFQKKGVFFSLRDLLVSNGNIYLPWIGYGWKHNVGLQFENFESGGAGETALGTLLKNTFSVDVVPGKYTLKAILYQKSASALPEITAENTTITQKHIREIPGKEKWKKIKFTAVVEVKDNFLDISFAPREKSHRQWGIKELEIQKQ